MGRWGYGSRLMSPWEVWCLCVLGFGQCDSPWFDDDCQRLTEHRPVSYSVDYETVLSFIVQSPDYAFQSRSGLQLFHTGVHEEDTVCSKSSKFDVNLLLRGSFATDFSSAILGYRFETMGPVQSDARHTALAG